jgi:hypothetical protein
MPQCRDCGDEVRWATTPKGKKIMLEVDEEQWSLGKKLWRICPGVEGLDGYPLSLLDIEQAGGEIMGYAVHWDVCGQDRDEETPREGFQREKIEARVAEDDPSPGPSGSVYGELYGKDTSQGDLFSLGTPAAPSEPRTPYKILRGIIKNWREMAETYDQEAEEHFGSLGHEKKAVAQNLRLCAAEIEAVLG